MKKDYDKEVFPTATLSLKVFTGLWSWERTELHILTVHTSTKINRLSKLCIVLITEFLFNDSLVILFLTLKSQIKEALMHC